MKITYKSDSALTRTEISYDGFGKAHIITDVKNDGTVNAYRLVWCGEKVCQKRSVTTNALIKSYDEQGEWSGANVGYYVKDHLGSVVGMMNRSATGQQVSIQYDPYGMVLNKTLKTAVDTSLAPDTGYAGMYYHEASGLNLTNYRWYNGFTRRWISRDPIGEAGGTNLYGYVGGNPLNRVDPLGLAPVEDYLNDWVCNSNSWENAFFTARNGKFGPYDTTDPFDADNRTAAEHYIFGRFMGSGEANIIGTVAYLFSGGYWGFGYQAAKQFGLYPSASNPSYAQLYWEEKAYTDTLGISNMFGGRPGSSCGCKGGR